MIYTRESSSYENLPHVERCIDIVLYHWHSSHNAVTHLRIKNCSHLKKAPNVLVSFSIPQGNTPKGKNLLPSGSEFLPLREVHILQRDTTD